jgi:hypothetical protein
MKKPFKETKFGKLLTEKVPEAARIVGDVLPDHGVLGIVKNLIDGATISPEEKKALLNEAREFELTELKLYMDDKASARSREVELAKAGNADLLMKATGFTLIAAFLAVVLSTIFYEIPEANVEAHAHLRGMVEGAFVGGMVFYYFGASKK